MRCATYLVFLLGLATSLALVGCGGGGGNGDDDAFVLRDVAPGSAVRVSQVDFLYPQGPHADSTWGRVLIDPAALVQTTGIRRGFLNVALGSSWVLVNVPVLEASEPPYAVYFDLGLGQQQHLDRVDLYVMHSNRGLGDVQQYMNQSASFPVERAVFAAEQLVPDIDPGRPPYALKASATVLAPRVLTTRVQTVTNVQCAHNQCMTMAVANAVQYQELWGVIDLPHDHVPGQFGDASLVGQLDDYCGRGGTSRTSGNGLAVTPMVDGLFEYLWDEGLTGILAFRHQNDGTGWTELGDGGNHGGFSSLSFDDGTPITWNYIWDRMGDGSGVVAVYRRDSGGGHAGRVTGAGYDDTGREWIRFSHDRIQANADPTDSLGLEDWIVDLDDTDGDGTPNFSPGRELEFVWVLRDM